MKKKERLHLISFALVFLILFSSAASAYPAQSAAVPSPLTETRITSDRSSQVSPAIYGDRIVWIDYRNARFDNDENDYLSYIGVYMYDLSASREKKITDDIETQFRPGVAICQDRVVEWYTLYDMTSASMYNLSTSKKTTILYGGVHTPLKSAIYGNRIVWDDLRNGDFDIYMYDLSTSKETRITKDKSDQINPAIYGNRIVWQDKRNGNWDIYTYDLSTSREARITRDKSDQINPAIYGNRIVWQDKRNGNWDIYMYDLSTSKEVQITRDKSDQINPAIYGNRIVWQDKRNGNWDIYMYDLSTSKETRITRNKSDQINPAIYEDRIVWEDKRNGNSNIYMCALSLTPPVSNFLASSLSGNAPLKVRFTDKSANLPTSWKWSFGDGGTSTEQNPVHTYSKAGTYTVKLTATNAAGKDTKTKTSYIDVKAVPSTSNIYISDLNLKGEWVKISNPGPASASLKGWKITDNGKKNTYVFPSYTLKPKSTVILYTGKGTSTATKLYWGSSRPVWEDKGDTAYLYDAKGKLISKLKR